MKSIINTINNLSFSEIINDITSYVYKPVFPFVPYSRFESYYRRKTWAPGYFIKLGLYTTNMNPVSKDIYDLSIEEIREKVKNKEIKLGLYYVHCLISEDSITEKDIIIDNHCVNNNDLFANDWECYYISNK
jgi:hypothetical protein